MQQALEVGLPLLVGFATSILQQDHLADWVNSVIALLLVILAGVVTAFLGGHLTSNVATDALLVMGSCIALQSGAWARPLFDFLCSKTQLKKTPPLKILPPAA